MASVLKEENFFLVYCHNFFSFTWKIKDGFYGNTLRSPKFNLGKGTIDSFLELKLYADKFNLCLHNPTMGNKGKFMFLLSDARDTVFHFQSGNGSTDFVGSRIILKSFDMPTCYSSPLTITYNWNVFTLGESNCSIRCLSNELLENSPESDLVNNLKELSNDLKKVLDHDMHSDIILKVGENSIKAHKMILKARSPVFQKMLDSDSREAVNNEVVISDIGAATLQRFLTYLYTGTVEKCGFEENLELFYAADKYEVLSLRAISKKELINHLQVDNACPLFSLANRHCDESLKEHVVQFVRANFDLVINTEAFTELNKDEMIMLMRLSTTVRKAGEQESSQQMKRLREC